MENGNANKKQKLHEKDKTLNKEKRNDLLKNKEKSTSSSIIVNEPTKDPLPLTNKEEKTTTVMNMLRAQRDAKILKSSGHLDNSKSTSSTSDESTSSSDSDSSESSCSDAADVRNSDEDNFQNINKNGAENKQIDNTPPTSSNVLNKVQVNGLSLSNNIPPHEIDVKFFDNLSPNIRDSITRIIDHTKDLKDNFLSFESQKLLYEYDHVFCIYFFFLILQD